jgi:hypothetical protein
MSNIRYTEYKKKQRGRYVWGVLQMDGRKQNFRTVGEGERARRKARKLAQHLRERVETTLKAWWGDLGVLLSRKSVRYKQ